MDDNLDNLVVTIAEKRGFISHDVAISLRTQIAGDVTAMTMVNKPLAQRLVDDGHLTKAQRELLEQEAAKQAGPKVIGGYQLVAKLGQGGMGAVYKAVQLSMQREVALKVLVPRLAKDQEFVERFVREARAAGKVLHPNVITCYDVGQDQGVAFMSLELVRGGDALKLANGHGGQLPEARALAIIRDCAHGLAAIHKAGLIHRDIKPANIFVTEDGQAKLADLGLARQSDGDDRMTQTGMTVGSPAYMSPDQARGDSDLDIRTDIYSLGTTLYHLLAGKPPYDAAGTLATLNLVINGPIPDLAAITPGIARSTAAIIAKAMAKDKNRRYPTPEALAADLDAAVAGKPLAAGPLLFRDDPRQNPPSSSVATYVARGVGSAGGGSSGGGLAAVPRWALAGGGVAAAALCAVIAWSLSGPSGRPLPASLASTTMPGTAPTAGDGPAATVVAKAAAPASTLPTVAAPLPAAPIAAPAVVATAHPAPVHAPTPPAHAPEALALPAHLDKVPVQAPISAVLAPTAPTVTAATPPSVVSPEVGAKVAALFAEGRFDEAVEAGKEGLLPEHSAALTSVMAAKVDARAILARNSAAIVAAKPALPTLRKLDRRAEVASVSVKGIDWLSPEGAGGRLPWAQLRPEDCAALARALPVGAIAADDAMTLSLAGLGTPEGLKAAPAGDRVATALRGLLALRAAKEPAPQPPAPVRVDDEANYLARELRQRLDVEVDVQRCDQRTRAVLRRLLVLADSQPRVFNGRLEGVVDLRDLAVILPGTTLAPGASLVPASGGLVVNGSDKVTYRPREVAGLPFISMSRSGSHTEAVGGADQRFGNCIFYGLSRVDVANGPRFQQCAFIGGAHFQVGVRNWTPVQRRDVFTACDFHRQSFADLRVPLAGSLCTFSHCEILGDDGIIAELRGRQVLRHWDLDGSVQRRLAAHQQIALEPPPGLPTTPWATGTDALAGALDRVFELVMRRVEQARLRGEGEGMKPEEPAPRTGPGGGFGQPPPANNPAPGGRLPPRPGKR